jgi:hypothetical protein
MTEHAWANLFVAGNWLLGVGLGGLVLLALHYVTGARWSTPLRRVPEAMAYALPAGAMLVAAVLLLCPTMWPAFSSSGGDSHGSNRITGPESPLHRIWMDRPFFLLRSLAYLALWLGFAVVLVRNSRREDKEQEPNQIAELAAKNRRLSALFLVVFGITCWLSSSDWLMSLDREWASTIYSVYNFAGLFIGALAVECLLVIWLQQRGSFGNVVNADHLHDLGTLLFGFSSFWMYTWFCQYMLIWYVNMPEETSYFRTRWQGGWRDWIFLDLALNWVVPFVVLIFRSAKRNPWILGAVSVVVLVGRWVDLMVMILPTQSALQTPGLAEAVSLVVMVGVFGGLVFRGLQKTPIMVSVSASENAT